MSRWFILAILGGLLGGCAGMESREDLRTVASVDLTRYAGTWYEIARLPMWFQRHCVESKAVYTVRSDGRIGVHNECVTDSGGLATADGVATVVDTKTNARLTVVFDNWFARLFGSSREGNYWILDVDPEYRTALVGTPDRRYLWMLARTPRINDGIYQKLVELARRFGYPVEDLIRAQRPWSSSSGDGDLVLRPPILRSIVACFPDPRLSHTGLFVMSVGKGCSQPLFLLLAERGLEDCPLVF